MEQFDPQPFLDEIAPMGLPYVVTEGQWPAL
jgi:saccharopine dehydrogenase (NAD+, L-lysine-forming)